MPTISRPVGRVPVGVDVGRWRMGQIAGILWPRGSEARQTGGLEARNQFQDLPRPDRLLVSPFVGSIVPALAWGQRDDILSSGGSLSRDGVTDITAATNEAGELRAALLDVASQRVETGDSLAVTGGNWDSANARRSICSAHHRGPDLGCRRRPFSRGTGSAQGNSEACCKRCCRASYWCQVASSGLSRHGSPMLS